MLFKVIQCQECRKHFKKKEDPLMHLQKGHLLVYNWVSVHGKYAVQNGKKDCEHQCKPISHNRLSKTNTLHFYIKKNLFFWDDNFHCSQSKHCIS